MIGTDFAGYRIEAVIGRGGWSTVYRAEGPRLGIRVALKILNADVAQDEGLRERFVQESRLAASLNHPNVIPIYDAGAFNDDLYIAMRYVPGGDLRKQLNEGPLEPRRALAILAQVASALDAAHAQGLVHRDVKPANIMLDSGPTDDAPEIAFVTDFGLLKQLHATGAPTPTGDLMGTIDYIAPEQIEGRPVDHRADTYSLGCVAYECFAGRQPFVRDDEAAVLWAHLKDDPPPLDEIDPALKGLQGPVARAMAKNPEDRFDSCLEFAAELREVIDPDDREAATVVRSRRPADRYMIGRRRPLLIGAAGLVLGAVGAAAAFLVADGGEPSAVPRPGVTRTVVETVVTTPPPTVPAYIPDTFRGSCRAVVPPTPDFDGSFTCDPGGPVKTVRYSHAFSGPTLAAYLRRRLEEVEIASLSPTDPIRQVGS